MASRSIVSSSLVLLLASGALGFRSPMRMHPRGVSKVRAFGDVTLFNGAQQLVADHMTPAQSIVTLKPDDDVRSAAATLITKDITGAPVVDADGRVVGVLSRADILFKVAGTRSVRPRGEGARSTIYSENTKRLQKAGSEVVSELMTTNPIFVTPSTTMQDAAALMIRHRLNRLLVETDGRLDGLVSSTDIVKLALCTTETCEELQTKTLL